jgi:hypothetical protein
MISSLNYMGGLLHSCISAGVVLDQFEGGLHQLAASS